MSPVLKVCSSSRKKRAAVILNEVEDISINSFVEKASAKLGIRGKAIVLEKDGIIIDELELLTFFSKDIFMILQENEEWQATEADVSTTDDSENSSLIANKQSQLESNAEAVQVTKSNSTQDNTTVADTVEESEPNSMQDDTTTDETSTRTTNRDFENFKIPWATFDKNLLSKLKKGVKTKLIIKETVNHLITQMRTINNRIPTTAMVKVAKELRDKYPNFFEDKSATGIRQGDGIANTLAIMRNRNNYLNRPSMNSDLSTVLNIPLKKRKSLLCVKAGCSNWQPDAYNDNVTEEIAEQHRQLLLNFNNFDLQDEETMTQVVLAMNESYPLQRTFVNNVTEPPKIEQIQECWPCLLKRTYMELHFLQLTGKEPKNILTKLEEDMPKLLAYGQMKNFVDLNEASTEDQRNLLAIKTVFHHFKEDYPNLFITLDVSNYQVPLFLSLHFFV